LKVVKTMKDLKKTSALGKAFQWKAFTSFMVFTVFTIRFCGHVDA